MILMVFNLTFFFVRRNDLSIELINCFETSKCSWVLIRLPVLLPMKFSGFDMEGRSGSMGFDSVASLLDQGYYSLPPGHLDFATAQIFDLVGFSLARNLYSAACSVVSSVAIVLDAVGRSFAQVSDYVERSVGQLPGFG